MVKIKQQTITELQKNLAKKIKQLKDEIKNLPAYSRRKKDEENWENFFTFFAFSALVGIVIFGTGGWLAGAASGTLLTLIIVEAGLFSSLAIGFSAWPMYNTYLWIRDLVSSEKIKSQNKDFDQCHKNLLELNALAAEKNYLSAKINFKLNNAIKCFPSGLFAQENADFAQLGLTDQIQRLEQQKKKLFAYSRKQKDKKNWVNIFLSSALASIMVGMIYLLGAIIVGAFYPAIMVSYPIAYFSIAAAILIGPSVVNPVLHMAYLWIRDLFSSAETKDENKKYAQLEKVIAELKKLDEQDSQLDASINSKLQIPVDVLTQTTDEQVKEEFLEFPENKKPEYVYKLFPEPITPANQKQLLGEQKSSGHVASFRH